jgi:hypothetical protein
LVVDDDLLRIGLAGQYVYYYLINGTIKRVPIGGGPPEVVAYDSPEELTGDATHLYFYTSNFGGQTPTIRRVPVAGGKVEDVAAAPAAPTAFTIDDRHVYFLTEGGFKGFEDVIGPAVYRVPLAGGPVTTIGIANKPDWIGLDASYVYWADKGVVWKTAKATAGTTPLGDGGVEAGGAMKVIDTQTFAKGRRYALDDEWIYWAALRHLQRGSKAGGGIVEELVEEPELNFDWPIADGADVFVTTVGFSPVNKLVRYHKADRTTKLVATWDGGQLVADATHLYMGSRGILKLPKP